MTEQTEIQSLELQALARVFTNATGLSFYGVNGLQNLKPFCFVRTWSVPLLRIAQPERSVITVCLCSSLFKGNSYE